MTGFEASEQALLATGSRLAELETETRQGFVPLRQEAETLLAGWTGGAAHGFAQGWAQWEAGFNECMSALAGMGQTLGLTGHDYGSSEQSSLTSINPSGSGIA